jgi:hypothetical protein
VRQFGGILRGGELILRGSDMRLRSVEAVTQGIAPDAVTFPPRLFSVSLSLGRGDALFEPVDDD